METIACAIVCRFVVLDAVDFGVAVAISVDKALMYAVKQVKSFLKREFLIVNPVVGVSGFVGKRFIVKTWKIFSLFSA